MTMALETAANASSLLTNRGVEVGGGTLTITSLLSATALNNTTTTTAPFVQSVPGPNAWTAGLVAEAVVRIMLGVLTVLVNTLVLLTLATTPSLRCRTNMVIASLAVTDLLVGLLSPSGLPIELQVVVMPLLCKLGYAGIMGLSSVSINHLLFVSIDRYLLISKPLRYSSFITKRRVWVFIVACWVWAAAIAIPFILGLTLRHDWQGECLAELMFPLWFILGLTLLHFVLPFLVMLYVHVAIFVVARRQQKAVKNSFRGSSNSAEANGHSSRAKLRAARLLALPCGYFYLSWGPWFFTMVWAIGTGSTVQPHGLERFVQTLCILNSLGNPVLYAVSQPVLGRAMLAKVTALGKACRQRCMPATSSYKGSMKHVETDTLVVPDRTESITVL